MRLNFLIAILITVVGWAWWHSTREGPYQLYSWMEWHGCPYGSCAPAFHPVPDGSFRALTCTSGWCVLHTYTYWTDENCNRLTACAKYKPHRGDH